MSENINPLLANIKLPGRIFQLPSRGLFYKNGELDPTITDGEIHVKPMSALDEITMKNPDQLFSGLAVESVFKHCIVGVNKPGQLLAKDVDAIMLFLRTVTYGPSFEFRAKHTCEHAKEHNYVADIDTMINSMTIIDPTLVDSLYTEKLPNGQVVRIRPNKYQQVIDLIKNNQSKKEITVEDQKANLMIMLLGVIDNVDGVTDEAFIKEWIEAISSPMVNRIGTKIDNINEWGCNLKWTCKCADCGESFEIDVPINPVSFFTE